MRIKCLGPPWGTSAGENCSSIWRNFFPSRLNSTRLKSGCPKAAKQKNTEKIYASICVAASPLRTTTDVNVSGPRRVANDHMVQGHCDVQYAYHISRLLQMGVPPGKRPLSCVNRGYAGSNIPRSGLELTLILECRVFPKAAVQFS